MTLSSRPPARHAAAGQTWLMLGENALEPVQDIPPEFDQWRRRPQRGGDAWRRGMRAAHDAFAAAAAQQPADWEPLFFQARGRTPQAPL